MKTSARTLTKESLSRQNGTHRVLIFPGPRVPGNDIFLALRNVLSGIRCLVVEDTVVEEFRVGHRAAQADLLPELRSEEAQALLLAEALTAPVAPVPTVRVPATVPLTAPAHLTAQTLVQFSTPQKQHLQKEGPMEAGTREGLQAQESMVCRDISRQDTTSSTPSQGLHQVPGAVRYDTVSKQNKRFLSQSGVKTALAAGAVGVGAGALTAGLVLNSYQEYRCQHQPRCPVHIFPGSCSSNEAVATSSWIVKADAQAEPSAWRACAPALRVFSVKIKKHVLLFLLRESGCER